MDNYNQLKELYDRHLKNDLSEEELNSFLKMLNDSKNEQLVSGFMDKTWEEMYDTKLPLSEKGAVIKDMRKRWYLSAASIIILLVVGGYLFFNKKNDVPVLAKQENRPVMNKVHPGGDKAVLTLGDGTQIVLDTSANGKLVQQNGIKVINLNGQLAYNLEGQTNEVLYNTVTTPRGGQYQLILSDGTKVWLNAASSLRFPIAFVGNKRNVELIGEGYFEVAPDVTKQFHVKVNDIDVSVIGTHFNINSYSDEPAIKTTLLEGKVVVKKGDTYVKLNAGQQASVLANQNNISVSSDADLNGVIAWKNGFFHFEGASLQELMRQISRWYDVEIEYKGAPANRKFGGEITRSSSFNDIIKVLEESKVKFTLVGKKLIVTQ